MTFKPKAEIEAFQEQMERVAELAGVELMDVYQDGTKDGFVEDDGFLHYTSGTLRAGFDVGNNLTPAKERANIKTVKTLIQKYSACEYGNNCISITGELCPVCK